MSREDSAEQIPYLSPPTAPRKDDTTTADDADYSTLKSVKKILDDGINALKNDFNAFELGPDKLDIETQILGYQTAYGILVPLQSMVDTAIKAVEDGRKV